MRPDKRIEDLIKKVRHKTTTQTDERILSDASKALEETVGAEGGRFRLKMSTVVGLGAFAVLLVVVLVLVSYLNRITEVAKQEQADGFVETRQPAEVKPEREIEIERKERLFESELQIAKKLFEDGDEDGLIRLLSQGSTERQLAAILFLARLGDAETIEKLDALSEQFGREKPNNMFKIAISAIENQLFKEKPVAVDTGWVFDLSVVHSQTGEPMANVELQIRGGKAQSKAVTDRQGRYRIAVGAKEPNYLWVKANADGFVPMQVSFQRGENVGKIPNNYILALEPGTSIGGIIQDEQGNPIEGALVFLSAPGGVDVEQVSISGHEEKTDADGRWRCDIVPAELSNIHIRLAHPDYIEERYSTTRELSMEELRAMTNVMVMEKGLSIGGSVFDVNNKPVEGATVVQSNGTPKHPRTKTDKNGQFGFSHVRAGEVTLRIQAEGYAPQIERILVSADTGPIEFRLEAGQTIRGRIVDINDMPIEGVQVSVSYWPEHGFIKWKLKTNSAGHFEWNDAPKGDVRFDFDKSDYMSVKDINLSPSKDEYVIELYPPLRISGQVVDAESNEPVKSFKLIHGRKTEDSDYVSWGFENPVVFTDGRYEYKYTVPFGSDGRSIRIEAAGYEPAVSQAFYDDQGDVVFDFKLQKAEGPAGTVYLPSGQIAEGAEVILCTREQSAYIMDGRHIQKRGKKFVWTGPDGRFSLPVLAEEYLLAVLHEQGYAEVTAEQLERSSDIFIEPWGRVEGIVRMGGRGVANQEIRFDRDIANDMDIFYIFHSCSCMTDENGYFVYDKLPPGRTQVRHIVKLNGNRSTSAHSMWVDVKAGQTVRVEMGE